MKSNLTTTLKKARSILASLMLVAMPLAISVACASTDEGSSKDEVCDEADAGTDGCPEIR